MIVFISCTKKKQDYPCKAREMYSASQWFRGGWKYAETLKPSKIYILSAKYGLLDPETTITPYNRTLSGAKINEVKRWSKMVAKQMKQAGVNFNEQAVFICGKKYREYIKAMFKNYVVPCQHL